MSKKFLFVALALLAVLLLSGCSSSAVRGTTWPGLAASDTTAYLSDGQLVYAIDLKDGKQLWQYPNSRTKLLFYATPAVTADGLVIVGSSGTDRSLLALDPTKADPETGKVPAVAWKFTGAQDHWVAAPLIVDNRLFAPNADGNLYIFDLTDGQANKQPLKIVKLAGRLWAQPVTDGKLIFVSSLDHSVYAIDKASYDVVWHKDLGGAVPSAPLLAAEGKLYVGSFASELEQFDPATGNHQPMEKSQGWIWGTPSLVDNNVYFGDLNGNFYSYNIESGKYNWAPVQPDGPITAGALVVNNAVLVATESGAIYQVDPNGKSKLWAQPGGKIYTTPVLGGDRILVAPLGAEAYLYAYDASGSLAWTFKPGS